jgi:hypothetical protein
MLEGGHFILIGDNYFSIYYLPIIIITISMSVWIGLDNDKRKISLFNWIIISLLLISIDIIKGFFNIYGDFSQLINYYENLFYLIIILIIFRILSAILIYVNIKNRNMKDWPWTFFAFCFPVFVLPAYFIVRNKKQEDIPFLVDEKQNVQEVAKSINKVETLCPNCKSINSKKLLQCDYCDTNLEIN